MTSDPDQIRDQITQTQRNISADVDALSEKLSPTRVVGRRVERTRSAMTNMKERIMGNSYSAASSVRDTAGSQVASARDAVSSTASSARETVGSAAETVGSAPDMIRRRTEGNPLAVGLIAFGAGWLISSLLPATPAEQRVATAVKDTASEHGQPVIQQVSQAAQDAKDQLAASARQAAESVGETASGAVSAVQDQTRSAAGDVTARAQQARDTVREQSGPLGG